MTRTPDEIKKGLECCSAPRNEEPCRQCPYAPNNGYCVDKMSRDAFYLIQQLQAENMQYHQETTEMYAEMCMLREKVHRLESELDAMKDEIDRDCETCKNSEACQEDGYYCMYCENHESNKTPCCNCVYGCNWEWRGVSKEDSNA